MTNDDQTRLAEIRARCEAYKLGENEPNRAAADDIADYAADDMPWLLTRFDHARAEVARLTARLDSLTAAIESETALIWNSVESAYRQINRLRRRFKVSE